MMFEGSEVKWFCWVAVNVGLIPWLGWFYCLQVLQQKFEDFVRDIHSNEDRVSHINVMAETLTKEKHPESNAITQRCDEINTMFGDLREVADSRKEVSIFFKFCN